MIRKIKLLGLNPLLLDTYSNRIIPICLLEKKRKEKLQLDYPNKLSKVTGTLSKIWNYVLPHDKSSSSHDFGRDFLAQENKWYKKFWLFI